MKRIKKIFLIALSSLFLSSIALTSSQYNAYAEEYVIDSDIADEPYRYMPLYLYNGNVKALVVRVGFSDHPVNNNNPVYRKFSDEYLRSLYEGKDGGFGLPYNGVFDYLHTSSYGKLSMYLEDIIDIQLDGDYENYISSSGYISYLNNEEFIEKFYSRIDKAGYDYDREKDVLYIWSVTGEESGGRVGYAVRGYHFVKKIPSCYAVMSIPKHLFNDDDSIINTILHETGHLLGSDHYYSLMNYPEPLYRDDTGNVMGYCSSGESSDYDAWIKWIQKWITKENAIGIDPKVGETGKIELTPYDSDTDEGKKIALFKCEDGYIAVDYRGGINNNDFDTDLRKKGFRFYRINDEKEIVEIYHKYITDPDTEDIISVYHLFAEGDEINDLLLYENDTKSLKITNIKTGNNPSFVYTCSEYKQDPIIQLDKELLVLNKGGRGMLWAELTPYDEDEKNNLTWESSDVSVATVDNDGNVTAVNPGTAKITAKTRGGNTAECEVRVNFIDVTNTKDWYYKPVYWAAEKGITTGTDGKFFPADSCIREQAVTFLWRMAGKPDPKNMTSKFVDVKDSKRYSYKAIMWGNENGIITGTDGKFYPTGTCTREQIVTMLWRLAVKPEPKNMNSRFKDVTSKTRYSYKAVMWAAENGITTGTNGSFYPAGQCKRREIVTFIYRYKN